MAIQSWIRALFFQITHTAGFRRLGQEIKTSELKANWSSIAVLLLQLKRKIKNFWNWQTKFVIIYKVATASERKIEEMSDLMQLDAL